MREIVETVDFHDGRPWIARGRGLGSRRRARSASRSGGCSAAERDRIVAYASSGELVDAGRARPPRAVALRDAGVRAVKIRLHSRRLARRPRRSSRRCATRSVPELEIMVDANQGWRMPGDRTPRWDVATAAQFARELERARRLLARGAAADRRRRGLRGAARAHRHADRGRRDGAHGRTRRATSCVRGGVDVVQPDVVLVGRDRAAAGGSRRSPTLRGRHVVAAHVVERLRAAREPARSRSRSRRARILEVPFDPPAWTRRAARLAAPGAARDRRGRDDRARRPGPGSASCRTSTRSSGTGSADAHPRSRPAPSPASPVEVEEVELDPPKAGEVLVRIAAVGVCHSDVRLADGDLGPGAGRPSSATRARASSRRSARRLSHVAPGDHVALCFVPACRSCRYCLAGKPNLCLVVAAAGARGTLLDGTSRLRLPDGTTLQHGLRTACFAEHVVVAGRGRGPDPARAAALAGRAARLRRRHRHRRRAERGRASQRGESAA